MSATGLTNNVYADGVGSVTGAELNTFLQVCASVSVVRTFSGNSNMTICLLGYTSPNDGGQGFFYWNPTSVAPDDGGVTTIRPSGNTAGAWLRIFVLATLLPGQGGYYAVDISSTPNTIVVALNPQPANLAALVGVPIRIKVANTSTGPVTLTVNGVGSASVVYPGGYTTAGGTVQANGIATVVYDGTSFQLESVSLYLPGLVSQAFVTVAAGPVTVSNNQFIQGFQNNETTRVSLIGVGTGNGILLGDAANATAIVVNCQTAMSPGNDNAIALGGAVNRWTAVYAINGTIQTSDPSLKTDIQPLPDCMPLIDAIHPIRYRWNSGPDQEQTHWGFSAPEIKMAMDQAGVAFGGYVKEDVGPESMRPDQLLAVLWKVVQELRAEVKELRGR